MASLFSDSWYRVGPLKPRLKHHAKIHRHRYDGQVWYVIHDLASGRAHRLSQNACRLISNLDGERTVDELWQLTANGSEADAVTQDEIVQVLGQLHGADLLHSDVTPDSTELFHRLQDERKKKIRGSYLNPLSIRVSLFDPDRLLHALMPWVSPLFSWFGIMLWLSVVGVGIGLAGNHWNALSDNFSDQVLSMSNLLVMAFVFPVLKALHEFGHGFAVKRYGGEVHDMGILLMTFMPMPYVDASASAAFPNKWQRAFVGAAGMVVEVFFASLAMILWVNVEPGLVRAIAFNVMVIAGLSTVLVNGNPLIRYDGYYILIDLIEIPNLGARANKYLSFLTERYLFGLRDAEPEAATKREKIWFSFYSIASYVYRTLLSLGIALFIASEYFFVGVILALWSLLMSLAMPLWKGLMYLIRSPRLARNRERAGFVTAGIVATLFAFLFFIPLPMNTVVEGVVWMPEQALAKAGTNGFIKQIVATPRTPVRRGDQLIVLEDPNLTAHIQLLESRVRELEARRDSMFMEDRVQAGIAADDLVRWQDELVDAKAREARLVVRAPSTGIFILPKAGDLPQRHVKEGDLLGYVVAPGSVTARVVVDQAQIDDVRHRTRSVNIRFPQRQQPDIESRVLAEVPAGQNALPSPALSASSGGSIATDPRNQDSTAALERMFQFELDLGPMNDGVPYGSRLHARFSHEAEPLAGRCHRALRRLFLSHFHV